MFLNILDRGTGSDGSDVERIYFTMLFMPLKKKSKIDKTVRLEKVKHSGVM